MPVIRNGRTGPGAPKPKGTRAKSGCYTCRIRRKKCDEARDHNGHCNTCVRLRVQCLGFGDKRPKWLTKSKCDEILLKIKRFLAGGSVLPRQSRPDVSYLILWDGDSEPVSSPSDTVDAYDFDPLPYENFVDDFGPGPVELEGLLTHWSRGYNSDLLLPQSPPSSYNPSQSIIPYDVDLTTDLYNTISLSVPPFSMMDVESRLSDAQLDKRYTDMVVGMQYQFSDERTRSEILLSIRSPGSHQASTRLLAFIHQRRHISPLSTALQDDYAQSRYSELIAALNDPHSYDDDQAMASLTMISTLLFDGGIGDWESWLNLVAKYAHLLLNQYQSPQHALILCNKKQAFLIKACIWFDVLASVTTQTDPSFLHVTRELFNPYASGVSDVNNPGSDMMTVMGCESRVVWALAEVSALAAWKQQEIDQGRLSVMALVQRAEPIFQCLNEPLNAFHQPDSRNLCSEVFRMATKVYLLSVVNGDFPDAEDMEKAVREAVQLMATADNAVVRSTVFAFFVCGCLTNDEDLRAILYERLRREGSVGNCAAVLTLLEQVFTDPRRKQDGVPWRQALRNSNLLLV
ncbi:fungal-specific transcription factor domain-containing protein [Desarmillaria tabescens]|uniref:Fungal-specific transcription factor domain-containing protein n=1 Tax=Armillaria tabescens TaxID=1929756 RepID=A0AA39NR15_ARMTA|nr:fungal-specific transcription factor domain-containing protein [Desarmillaria tabescens]KAK0470105.1 fungal-specific transcription factor domain-containing protein [Desarmillaria tabescens]